MKNDIFYMDQALNLAQKAFEEKEVPVGALILKEGQILAKAFNKKESQQNPLGHAEIEAIQQASKQISSWRLKDCSLYVTLEPCLMCIGAILEARISHLIYGCKDTKKGFDSFYQLTKNPAWNHKLKITSGIQSEQCSEILIDFFKKLRKK